jgi:hypothetical protein
MAGIVISTLTDSLNVSPILWRPGSLTQRVADLALGGGGGNPAGSQTASTGIVRGFEVYPDTLVSQKVELLVAQGTLDSLVVFTDPVLESALQYRTFAAVPVVFSVTGNRYLAFRPDYANRVIELVDYPEADFDNGDLTADGALLIAVVNVVASTVVTRTGIRYAGQSAAPALNPFARAQVYSPELVDRYVLEFSDDLPIPYEVTGPSTAAITGNALVISVSGAGVISFPVFQYMKPDARVPSALDVSCKIRAIIHYDDLGTTPLATAQYILSNGGYSTSSGQYPYGQSTLLTGGSGFVTTIEIIPFPGLLPARPDWGSLEIDFLSATGTLTIHKIIFEVDRVYAPIQTDSIILGAQSYQGSTPNVYATIGSTGLRVADTTPADDLVSVVYNTGVDVSEGTVKLARVTADGLGIYDDVDPSAATELVVLDKSSVDVRDKSGTTDVFVHVTPNQIEVETSTVSPDVTFETTIQSDEIKILRTPTAGFPQSVTATWENAVAEKDIYSATFGDISSTPAPANSFGVYAADSTSYSYVNQAGFLTFNLSTFAFSSISPLGFATTGSSGFIGINAPNLLAKVTWDGTNWAITSSYCIVGTGALGFEGVTNIANGFTLRKVGATFTYAFATSFKATNPVAASTSTPTDVSVGLLSSATANDYVYVLAF